MEQVVHLRVHRKQRGRKGTRDEIHLSRAYPQWPPSSNQASSPAPDEVIESIRGFAVNEVRALSVQSLPKSPSPGKQDPNT
jgi:hypothetical protein